MYQRQVTFKEAVMRALTENYCNFEGRSSRSEYWWYSLFCGILGLLIFILFASSETAYTVISGLINLALLLPGIGLAIRRLHDVNRSGWWLLIIFIPLIGAIILLVWNCQESFPGDNQYGPVPNLE